MTCEPTSHTNRLGPLNKQNLRYTAADTNAHYINAVRWAVQTLNSAMATFDEFSMGRRSRRRCISTSRWWFSHSCTARFTSL